MGCDHLPYQLTARRFGDGESYQLSDTEISDERQMLHQEQDETICQLRLGLMCVGVPRTQVGEMVHEVWPGCGKQDAEAEQHAEGGQTIASVAAPADGPAH